MNHAPAVLQSAVRFLEEGASRRDSEFAQGNGRFFKARCEQWMARAQAEFLLKQSSAAILDSIREGMIELRTALEAGGTLHPWERWHYFHTALAVSDRSTAHFLGALPESVWNSGDTPLHTCGALLCRLALALFREEEAPAMRFSQALQSIPVEELFENGEEIRTSHRILESIRLKDPVRLSEGLDRRAIDRRGREAMDLVGLGLRVLARGRGVEVRGADFPFA